MNEGALVVAIIFAIIGLIILIMEILKRLNCKESTIGIVRDIVADESRNSDGNISVMLHPIFEYKVLGRIYVQKSSFGSTSCKYYIGQEIEIMYNPKKPNQYYVNGRFGAIVLGGIFFICGIIFLFIA